MPQSCKEVVDVTPLESKVEGLIKQACDFKALQQTSSGRTSVEEHDSCRIEVQRKLDEASHRQNIGGAHYEVKAGLLKELQLLEDQKKDLSSQVAASKHFLQEAEREGQVNILNATKVMDAATKASSQKAKAYIKESFEDLKNFQWNPLLTPFFFFFS
ncbi:hypothetical protein Cgig2_003566 [Carnegiea gigantea]|uniref:Uncharacterized protein n=1 Tax=Carnegiea gigantea TaxID=171969 RepID=A0A9Q1JWZ1_9CARY|nr:hypothetical protein Cgig2_003566 [Carnegiea gigantea]